MRVIDVWGKVNLIGLSNLISTVIGPNLTSCHMPLRKKGFNMVDNSAGAMISSATGIFLSFLHAKVGRERLVYLFR